MQTANRNPALLLTEKARGDDLSNDSIFQAQSQRVKSGLSEDRGSTQGCERREV